MRTEMNDFKALGEAISITCKSLFAIFFMSISIKIMYAQTTSLEQQFRNPPSSAKVGTIWFWINGNVTKEGIIADLEAMKRVGIQEAIIFNVNLGHPKGVAPYLGEAWLEFFHFAALEARRLGLDLGFHNGAGWSSSGSLSITPEYAMQELVYSEMTYLGGGDPHIRLSQPPTHLGYYRDIAVLAFPKPQRDVRIDDLDLKILSHKVRSHLPPDDKLISASAIINKEEIVDLTSKLKSDGFLEWEAPEKEWVILRFGHTPTGEMNRFPSEGGQGLECDKMNAMAVDFFFEHAIMPIIDRLDTLVGTTVSRCHIDSYEVGTTNWTADFANEFRKLRAYDCLPYLPSLAGYYVESGEETERFLWDFRRTIGDLIASKYYGRMSELSHQYGMDFSIEPYWGPFDNMQVGETADRVMSEFWSGSLAFFDTPKFTASIAKLKGNPIAEAEAFTGVSGWDQHPATIKAMGDLTWAQGINRFVVHGYVHQPWDTGPGLTLQRFGTHFNRLNTWWNQSKPFFAYLNRGQFLLQQGRSVADIMVFTGESSPNDALLIPEIKALGYDYDLIGSNQILSLSVSNGMIATRAGDFYQALVLPETHWMTPQVLAKLNELIDSGGTIISSRPKKSPSLTNYPHCDEEVLFLTDELWNTGRIKETSVVQFLKNGSHPPDFSIEQGDRESIDFIHRNTENADIYFLVNSLDQGRELKCRFRISGKQPEFWDAETGDVSMAPVWQDNGDGTTTVSVPFSPKGTVFVLFREPPKLPVNIVEADITIYDPQSCPLPNLRIEKAEYGTFLPNGLVDVTDVVNAKIKQNKLRVQATRNLCYCDPAPGYVKELRIRYKVGADVLEKKVRELEWLDLDASDKGKLEILQAVFGKFERGLAGIPPVYPAHDITDKVKAMLASGIYEIPVNPSLCAEVVSHTAHALRVTYTSHDEPKTVTAKNGEVLKLTETRVEPRIEVREGSYHWVTPFAGGITFRSSTGKISSYQMDYVPPPIELKESWDVVFPLHHQSPKHTHFDSLRSWAYSEDKAIRYFSGTAIYIREVMLPPEFLQREYSLVLDLGRVKEIAEVFINGEKVDILWKAPFTLNLDGYVSVGSNTLEVKITNLWPNRLIGDEHLPLDYERRGPHVEKWPDWLQADVNRPTERTTFAGYKHWDKDDNLLPSGLLGPVKIIISKVGKLDVE